MSGRGWAGPGDGPAPCWTRAKLAEDLAGLGLVPTEDVLVHCSLRSIGRLEHGPRTLLEALGDVLGPASTVAVPTQTTYNSWSSPDHRRSTRGMTAGELSEYLGALPGFDPDATPSQGMGAFAEYVRTRPGACRSTHPQTSFAALGPAAAEIARPHPLASHLGEDSPLGRLHARGARTLLLGVGFDRATVFHLAEYWPGRRRRAYHAKIGDPGGGGADGSAAAWVRFEGIELNDSDFGTLGEHMVKQEWVRTGPVGSAPCYYFPMPEAVEFARGWFAQHRLGFPSPSRARRGPLDDRLRLEA
jgi:aminoglycoside 3-N-acetyltransferase